MIRVRNSGATWARATWRAGGSREQLLATCGPGTCANTERTAACATGARAAGQQPGMGELLTGARNTGGGLGNMHQIFARWRRQTSCRSKYRARTWRGCPPQGPNPPCTGLHPTGCLMPGALQHKARKGAKAARPLTLLKPPWSQGGTRAWHGRCPAA